MTPRGEEGDGGRLKPLELHSGGHQVPFHVVDSDEGETPCPGGGLGEAVPDEQGPDQARPGGGGHAVEVVGMDPGAAQRLMGERAHRLDVGPRRHLRHHPAEASVEVDLGGEDIGQDLGSPDHRHRRLVAGSLEGEDGRIHPNSRSTASRRAA